MAEIEDLPAWVRLTRTGLLPRRLNVLLDEFGSPTGIFQASPSTLSAAPGMTASAAERLLQPEAAQVDEDLRLMERLDVRLITRADPDYPPLLQQIFDPPSALYVRGTLGEGDRCAVAMVGTRRCSAYGRMTADRLARDLVTAGVTVVSGLARGIDTAAHLGALAAGGRTVAVLGSGLDRLYPPENRGLAERIAASGGAVVSEYPMTAEPDAWHFPARNRIISGWSQGVCILEAPMDSGAFITATFAAEQARDVFAVPGPVTDPRSKLPHALIREGAALVEDASDILAALGVMTATADPQLVLPAPDLTDDEQLVLKLLGPQPRMMDDLIAESGSSTAHVSAALMLLELKGLARKASGTTYIRVFGRLGRER